MSAAKCPGQDPRFLKPQDVAEVKCPDCGAPVEFWPDEQMRKCPGCGRRSTNPQNSMKCLEWCRHAEKCLAAIRGESSVSVAPLPDMRPSRRREQ